MTPDRPLGGWAVPKTGVTKACSMERSRGHFSGCRSGNSQRAPVRSSWNCSFGVEGRSRGSRSAPQPGMRARNWSAVSRAGVLRDATYATGMSSEAVVEAVVIVLPFRPRWAGRPA
jgi:hypothetical protein